MMAVKGKGGWRGGEVKVVVVLMMKDGEQDVAVSGD